MTLFSLVSLVELRNVFLPLSVLASSFSLIIVLYKIAWRGLAWTRALLPLMVACEFLRIAFHQSTRGILLVIALSFELAILLVALLTVFRLRRTIPRRETASVLYESIVRFLPENITKVMVSELMTIGMSLRTFRSHRSSATESFRFIEQSPLGFLWIVVLVGSIPELILFHYVLKRHPFVDGLLTFGCIWGFLWVVGYYISFRDAPHEMNGNQITVRYAFQRNASFSVSNVSTIALKKNASREDYKTYSAAERFCISHADLLEVTFSSPITIRDFTGKTVESQRLAISVDERGEFTRSLQRNPSYIAVFLSGRS